MRKLRLKEIPSPRITGILNYCAPDHTASVTLYLEGNSICRVEQDTSSFCRLLKDSPSPFLGSAPSPQGPAMGSYPLPSPEPQRTPLCSHTLPDRGAGRLLHHTSLPASLLPSEITLNCSISVKRGRCMILFEFPFLKKVLPRTALALTASRKGEVIWGQSLFAEYHEISLNANVYSSWFAGIIQM